MWQITGQRRTSLQWLALSLSIGSTPSGIVHKLTSTRNQLSMVQEFCRAMQLGSLHMWNNISRSLSEHPNWALRPWTPRFVAHCARAGHLNFTWRCCLMLLTFPTSQDFSWASKLTLFKTRLLADQQTLTAIGDAFDNLKDVLDWLSIQKKLATAEEVKELVNHFQRQSFPILEVRDIGELPGAYADSRSQPAAAGVGHPAADV